MTTKQSKHPGEATNQAPGGRLSRQIYRRLFLLLPLAIAAIALAAAAMESAPAMATDALVTARVAYVGAGSQQVDAPSGATSWTNSISDVLLGCSDFGLCGFCTEGANATSAADISFSETGTATSFSGVTFSGHASGSSNDEYCPPYAIAEYQIQFQVTAETPYTFSGSQTSNNTRGFTLINLTNGRYIWQQLGNAGQGTTLDRSGTLAPARYYLIIGIYPISLAFNGSATGTFTLGGVTPAITIGDAVDTEGHSGTTLLHFPVSLSTPATGPVSVSYGTQDIGGAGSAQAASDYTATFGTLNFSTGDSQKVIDVPVIGDTNIEPNETFRVALLSATGATISGGTGLGTILNDDTMNFDWTVPDRFGADADGDGKLDYFAPDGPLIISPTDWPADFTLVGPCDATHTITWFIDGVLAQAGDPRVLSYDPHSCLFKYQFPAEGKYSVKVEVRDASNALVGSVTRDVTIQDWLIVSIGDSVASGEGNPDVPGGASASWENTQCHRSSFAGPARAALAIETADPKTSVTFVHLACSGATIDVGLLGSYEGQIPGAMLPPQLQQLQDRIGTRELDALFVSAGGNDIKFANIVFRCFVRPLCDQGGPGSAANLYQTRIAQLPTAYTRLRNGLTGLSLPSSRVYISEYFDPTRDGAPCDDTILNDHPAQGPAFGITGSEAGWASNTVLTGLNAAVANAASTHGWKFVSGITSQFLNHGYCASDHWVVRWSESQSQQGNEDGTLHPNRRGHQAYGERLAASLTDDLYTGGNLLDPRPPQ